MDSLFKAYKKDEGNIIETKNVNYKIDKVINKHIERVKACKIP